MYKNSYNDACLNSKDVGRKNWGTFIFFLVSIRRTLAEENWGTFGEHSFSFLWVNPLLLTAYGRLKKLFMKTSSQEMARNGQKWLHSELGFLKSQEKVHQSQRVCYDRKLGLDTNNANKQTKVPYNGLALSEPISRTVKPQTIIGQTQLKWQSPNKNT